MIRRSAAMLFVFATTPHPDKHFYVVENSEYGVVQKIAHTLKNEPLMPPEKFISTLEKLVPRGQTSNDRIVSHLFCEQVQKTE